MLPYDQSVRRLGAFAFLAAFCESLSFYAAALYAFKLSHSIIAVSVVMTAVAVAEAGGAILGGTLVDRLDRRRVACLAALGAAALLFVLAVGADVVTLTIVMVLATVAAAPIRPVVGAALPNLAVEGNLAIANGYVQALRSVALTLAPVVAGIGVSVVGARGIFAVAATSLLLAAIMLAFVRGDFRADDGGAEEVSTSPFAGLVFLVHDRVLLIVVAAGALAWLAAAYCAIADLPLALEEFHVGETGYGVLIAAWGVGTTLGALGASGVIRRFGAARTLTVTMLIEGVALAAVAGLPSFALVLAMFGLGGIFGGIGATADQMVIQERVPDAARGRVRATTDAIMTAAYALALGLGGFAVELFGARGTYLLGGLGVGVAGLLATIALARHPAAVAA